MDDAPERIWCAHGRVYAHEPGTPGIRAVPYVPESLYTALQARLAEVEAWNKNQEAMLRQADSRGDQWKARAESAESRLAEVEAGRQSLFDLWSKEKAARFEAETRAEAGKEVMPDGPDRAATATSPGVTAGAAQPASVASVTIDSEGTVYIKGVDGPEKAARDVYSALHGTIQPAPDVAPYLLKIGGDRAVCVGGRWDAWLFGLDLNRQWVSLRKLERALAAWEARNG